jgi:hypothetical protein
MKELNHEQSSALLFAFAREIGRLPNIAAGRPLHWPSFGTRLGPALAGASQESLNEVFEILRHSGWLVSEQGGLNVTMLGLFEARAGKQPSLRKPQPDSSARSSAP